MKKRLVPFLIASLALLAFLCSTLTAFAVDYTQVAEEGERAEVQEVGVEGMEPIAGKDVEDGEYDVTVQSSSSMFRIEKAKLTVKNDTMEADITLSGTGYLKLFPGTAQQAANSDESAYIGYTEGSDVKYTYTVPVAALDQPIECASFSKRKEKWYDHAILFEAKSLPKDAVKVELPDYDALEKAAQEKRIAAMASSSEAPSAETPAESEGTALEDGVYQTEVTLEGGSGKASVASPTELRVKDGKATAIIEWSSPNYDYMIVDGQKYEPVNKNGGNSKFEIPVASPNGTIEVIADTTAMSTPHEITYQLTFRTEGKRGDTWVIPAIIGMVASSAIVLFAVYRFVVRKKR